ncbi:MAG: protein-L-isoaspartate(D-aspartate) O-methyltransferase [Bacteroidales bacterium]|nr:protein-L-isoaspartate(D-aspartate) O-methyltransferase [Bacteroidales bacterium]
MEDSLIHKGQRNQLVKALRDKGITDEKVLFAIGQIPRHLFFFDKALEKFAYEDKAFPIASHQTISQPYTVALESQLLNITGREKVLEIGTGSGYQAAVLSLMGASVYSIERQQELYTNTTSLLKELKYAVSTFLGDGFKGLPQYAPFDRIIITAAAPFIPRTLLDQLKIGGILVSPIENDKKQELIRIKKISDTDFEQTLHGECAFVPMLEGINFQKNI